MCRTTSKSVHHAVTLQRFDKSIQFQNVETAPYSTEKGELPDSASR